MSNLFDLPLRSFCKRCIYFDILYSSNFFRCLLAVVYEQKQQIEQNEDESEVNNNEQQ